MVNKEKNGLKVRSSSCLFCSLGCGFKFRKSGEDIIGIDYDKDNPVNHGALCPRGYYNLELINHPKRITEPKINYKRSTWSDAISHIRQEMKNYKPDEVAILVSGCSSNEDAYVAAKMANTLGTKNISASGERSDLEAYEGSKLISSRTYFADPQKTSDCEALLIVGDLLTRSPVLSKRVNNIKYGKRGNQVIVIDPNISHTSWFATTHLKVKPGTETVLLAGILKVISEENKRGHVKIDLKHVSDVTGISTETIERVSNAFDGAPNGCIIYVPGINKQRNDLAQYFVNMIASYSLGKKHMTFYSYGNTLGVNKIIDSEVKDRAGYEELNEKIDNGKIKILFLFGGDISTGSKRPHIIVKTSYFRDTINTKDHILLPLATHMERKGNVTFTGFRTESFLPTAHNVGDRSLWKIISNIMDFTLGYDEILQKANDALYSEGHTKKIDLDDLISEVKKINAVEIAKPEDVTHFGDNEMVKNFFWHRVNNG